MAERTRSAWAVMVATVLVLVGTVSPLAAPRQASDEDVARRQLDSGRAFARQGNHAEALKDFRAVAETHAATSVADNALLEMARYYFDVALDTKEADAAVDQILKKYPTSDSAPDAYLIAGQLALARSRQPADLEIALANFDRVSRLFPSSDAVPRALQLAGHVYRLQGRLDDALVNLVRVEAEHAGHAAAVQAYLEAALTLVAKSDPIAAIEELQQVRNRWPGTPEADVALGRITLLHRLHVRGKSGAPAFALSTETVGPARLQNVLAMASARGGAMYWATETGLGVLAPTGAPLPPSVVRPRGLALDASGQLVALESGSLRPFSAGAKPMSLSLPRPNNTPQPLQKLDAAVQLSNGEWIVADEDERALQRFTRSGEHAGAFATVRARRLAVNTSDEIVGVDRDEKGLVFVDVSGKLTGRLPARGTGYVLENIEDLAFDAFGHLYVLDRTGVAVFSPWLPAVAASTPGRRAGGQAAPEGRGTAYQLVTFYSEPERSPGAIRRATAFAIDGAGALFIYDERAERVRVYR